MGGKEWPRISPYEPHWPPEPSAANTPRDIARVRTQRLPLGRLRPRRSRQGTLLMAGAAALVAILVAVGAFGTARGNWFALANPSAPNPTNPGFASSGSPALTATAQQRSTATATSPATPASRARRTPTPTSSKVSTPSRGASSYNIQTLIGAGGALPSDAFCASVALAQGDSREAIAANAMPNQDNVNHTGVWNGDDPAQSDMGRVDGNFSGTTDQILVWAACKWGFPADSVRAQAVQESSWRQSLLGDCGVTTQSATHGCPSVGILQVKGADLPPTYPNTWPYAYESTAWNADYTLSVRRACFDGKITWLGNGYAAGNMWGCVGEWFSGRWLDAGANNYISLVEQHEANRDWLGYY